MSAPRNRPYSGYPWYQQPRFSQHEYAGLSFIVPFIFGGSFLGIVNLVGFLAGFIGIGSSVTPRQRSWCRRGIILNAAPWVIVGVAYVLIDVWVRISISSY